MLSPSFIIGMVVSQISVEIAVSHNVVGVDTLPPDFLDRSAGGRLKKNMDTVAKVAASDYNLNALAV